MCEQHLRVQVDCKLNMSSKCAALAAKRKANMVSGGINRDIKSKSQDIIVSAAHCIRQDTPVELCAGREP